MTVPAACHHCGGRFGVLACAPPSRCPCCRGQLDAFDPGHVIRAVTCSGGCGARLAVTFERVQRTRPLAARCPLCFETWHFCRVLQHDGLPFEPIMCVDLGD